MKYIGPNISFIFTKIKELLNSHNTSNSAHSELFKSWTLLRDPTNAEIADALAVTHKNGIGDVLVQVANTQTFALEDMKLFFRPARFQQTSATESRYEGIYITMDGTQGRYVAKTFADSEIMTPEGPSTISTPSELALYPAASDAVLYTPQTLTEAQQKQARANITVTKSYQIPTRVSGNDLLVDGWAAAGGYPSGFDIIASDIEQGALPYFVADDCIFLCTGIHHSARDSITFVSGTVDYSNLTRIVYKNAYWESGTSIIHIQTMEVSQHAIEERAQTEYFYVGSYGYIYGRHYEELAGDNPKYDIPKKYPFAVVDGKFNNAVLPLISVDEENKKIIYARSDILSENGESKVQGLVVGDMTTPFQVIDIDIPVYIKPADGIPKSDLAQSVQTSLTKADTAISLGLTTATPGQIIKVKTVQDGKPTEWEAVDDRLPKVSSSDYGKVLVVDQIGEFEYGYGLTNMPALSDIIPLGITNASPGQFAKVSSVDDFGRPAEWEAADIYEKPASGIPKSDLADDVQTSLAKADTAIQSQTIPDWNQNDETAADYVKNRPFYTGNPVETVLVEESTVSFSFSEDDGAYMGELKSTFSATVGETYKVSWDGTVYECACADFHNTPVIGNLSIAGAGANTGEPFIIVPNGSSIYIYTADTSASHTVSISATVVPVVKIDEKYLPISTDDSYGVVKKADIVSAYNLPFLAPHDQMVEAIAAFKTGNASIVWGGYKVIDACYYSSNDTISVVFVNEPLRVTTYSTNSNGFYDRRLGSSTYGELQGNNVLIVNDEGDYIVLVTEGTTGGKNLSVGADRISFYSNYGLSTYELILKSSTANSTKTFKITVDDSGTLTATEVS